MEIYLQNTMNGFIPLYPSDYDEKRKLKIGEVYKANIVNPRNYEFHKKFMALINLGHENTSLEMPFDSYRKYVTLKAGFYKAYQTGKGTYFEPESISFSSMSQDKFEDVFSRVLDVIIKDIGFTNEEVEKQLVGFM